MLKGLREKEDFMFCRYDMIEIALCLDDILENKKIFITEKFGKDYDYSSLLTKRSSSNTKDETADINTIEENHDSQNKEDKISEKKSEYLKCLCHFPQDYDFSASYYNRDKNELHEIKKNSRFSKSIRIIEETILKVGDYYIEMKQKKEEIGLNQEENDEFSKIKYFFGENEILLSLYIKTTVKKQMIEENKTKNKRVTMSIYSTEECIFFLVILTSPIIRNSIKFKEKKNKTKLNYEKRYSEETLRFMEIVESTHIVLNMILQLLPKILKDPIFKDTTLQKKRRKGELNISKDYIERGVDIQDISDAVCNLFELANLKNTIEFFMG